MALRAFGPVAEAFAARLPAALPAIVADPAGAAEALHEAVLRRRRGERFAAVPLVDDRRVDFALGLVPQILAGERDYERRRATVQALALEQLTINGQPQAALRTLDDRVATALRDFVLCADAVVVPSRRAGFRIADRLGVRHRAIATGIAALPVAPAAPPRAGTSILVWAPHLPAAALFTCGVALTDAIAPPAFVCADPQNGMAAGLPGRWHDMASFAAEGGAVGAVLVADPRDPAEALRIAAWGLPMAVATSAGADEVLLGVPQFDVLDPGSIFAAAQHALGGPPPTVLPAVEFTAALEAALAATEPPVFGASAPWITSITSTKNRPAYVRRLLAALRAQTYPNVEIIIVNDGGVALDDVIGGDPRVISIVNERSEGVQAAQARATQIARGTYVTYISDDDVMYPDHLARCVAALERTGAALARSLMITTLHEPDGDRYVIAGHAIYTPLGADPWDQLANYSLGSVALVWRTAMIRETQQDARFGAVSDWAQYLHVAASHEVIALDAVSREQDLRLDGSQTETSVLPADAAAQRRRMFDAYARPDRPLLEQRRSALVAGVAAAPPGGMPPLPARIPSRPDAGVGPGDLRV